MSNPIIHALANQGHIRLMAIDSTQLVQQAKQAHDLWATSCAALGRTLSIGALMGKQLKNKDESILIRIDGSHDIKLLSVRANAQGDVVGFVSQPHNRQIKENIDKLDVGGAIGPGTLSVSRNLGLRDEFTSTIHLVSGEIGDDFAMYFTQSEQLPSAVSVGVLVDEYENVIAAGALLIQMMPGHSETDVLMAQHVVDHLKPISQIFKEGMTPKELILNLFDDIEIVQESSAQFNCDCSQEKMRLVLNSISADELNTIKQQDGMAQVECHYCGSKYIFDENDLDELIRGKHIND